MFQVKSNFMPILINGYSFIPKSSVVSAPSSGNADQMRNTFTDDTLEQTRPTKLRRKYKRKSSKTYFTSEDLSMTFHTTMSSLVRALSDDATFHPETYALNVLHAFLDSRI